LIDVWKPGDVTFVEEVLTETQHAMPVAGPTYAVFPPEPTSNPAVNPIPRATVMSTDTFPGPLGPSATLRMPPPMSAIFFVTGLEFSTTTGPNMAAGDYLALLAYLDRRRDYEARLQTIRHRVRERTRAATCVGFGPRFLHSTGQAYKGGPNSGVFLQITCEDAADVPVPGRRYSFGTVKAAQAQGDFAVLAGRGRRALRVHLGPDVTTGLEELTRTVDAALAR